MDNFSIFKLHASTTGFYCCCYDVLYLTLKQAALYNLSLGVRIADTEHLLKVDCPEVMDS